MATTQADIRGWLERGKEMGATHMIVVCDTYDWEDLPRYVMPNENVRDVHTEVSTPGNRVMEVYSLRLDWDFQLNEHRAFHFD